MKLNTPDWEIVLSALIHGAGTIKRKRKKKDIGPSCP